MTDKVEDRTQKRNCTVFRPARVDVHSKSYLGLMSDISADGAGYTCPIELEVGELVRVATGDEPLRVARVAWKSDERFGVKFETEPNQEERRTHFRYRSVRVPVELSARLYLNGIAYAAQVVNVSPNGVAIRTDAQLTAGAIFSLVVNGQDFTNVTTRWCRNGLVGARLPTNVRFRQLQKLIAGNCASGTQKLQGAE